MNSPYLDRKCRTIAEAQRDLAVRGLKRARPGTSGPYREIVDLTLEQIAAMDEPAAEGEPR